LRAFAAALKAAQERGAPFSVCFAEFEGMDELYLEKGEAFVEGILKEIAAKCGKLVPGYRYGDNRLAVLFPEVDGPTAVKRMGAFLDAVDREALQSRKLGLRLKVGIAYCEDCRKLSIPHLLRFLQGGMAYLHGQEGAQLEFFQFC
jgi:GGDEF domain-containing protein